MSILSGVPVLNCQAIESTLDFYLNALHFVIVKKREAENVLQWVHLMNGNTTLMLQRAQVEKTPPENTAEPKVLLYFYIDNIAEINHLLKVNYQMEADIFITKYRVKECNLFDPEGNMITLGQKMVVQTDAK